MNMFSAYTQPVPGGYRVMLRFSKDGHPKPVMDAGDKPHRRRYSIFWHI